MAGTILTSVQAQQGSSTVGAGPTSESDEHVVVESGPLERLQRSAALGQMVEEIAHELGNSLGAVAVLADSLRSDPTPDGKRLDVLDRAIGSMRRLLDLVAEFGQPNTTTTSPTSIETLLAQSEDLVRLVVPGDLLLTVASNAGDATVDLSGQEFQQVLLNLVLNARDATSPGGTIAITTEASADAVSLTVSDNGVGMDEQTLLRVFDSRYSTKGEDRSGLGLAICRDIAERHEGHLVASSELHRGSTFTMSVPRSRRPSGVAPRVEST